MIYVHAISIRTIDDACRIVYAKQTLINFMNIPKWYPDIPAY